MQVLKQFEAEVLQGVKNTKPMREGCPEASSTSGSTEKESW